MQGDTLPPHDGKNPILTTAMNCNGGFVTVPANSVVNPGVFTVECWARPEWDAMASPACRTVVDSRTQGGGLFFGFVIFVNENGNWEAQLGGTGSGNFLIVTAGEGGLARCDPRCVDMRRNQCGRLHRWRAGRERFICHGGVCSNTTAPLVIGVGAPYLRLAHAAVRQ